MERTYKKVLGQLVYRHSVNGVNITIRRVLDGTVVDWVDTDGKVHHKTIFGGLAKAKTWVKNNIDEEGRL